MAVDALKYPLLNSSNIEILLSKTSMCIPGFVFQTLYALSFLESVFLFILPCYRSSVQYSRIYSRQIWTDLQLITITGVELNMKGKQVIEDIKTSQNLKKKKRLLLPWNFQPQILRTALILAAALLPPHYKYSIHNSRRGT